MAVAGMNIAPINKRTVRQQVNPLDRATIVSIYPRAISEIKHTIQPGVFKIDAGSEEKPALLVVEASSWWRDIGDDMPLIEIPNGAILVAESFVNDYCNGMLMVDDNQKPGLFFIPGELTIEKIKADYASTFKGAIQKQRNWFDALVRLGDAGWSRTNGNPNSISDLSRMAAEYLGQTDKDWMKASTDIQKVRCVACGNLRNPAFPVCSACNRVVDIKLAEKLGIVEPAKK